AFMSAQPQAGDWLDINGHGQCLATPGSAPRGIMDAVANRKDLHCPMVGWIAQPATLQAAPSDAATTKLLALMQTINPSSRLNRIVGEITVPGLNKRVQEIAAFCGDSRRDCYALKNRMASIATDSGDWDDALAQAKAGELPASASIESWQARDLFSALQSALHDQVTATLYDALQATLAAHPAPVVLQPADAAFRMTYHAPSRSYSRFSRYRRRKQDNDDMDPDKRLLYSSFRLRG